MATKTKTTDQTRYSIREAWVVGPQGKLPGKHWETSNTITLLVLEGGVLLVCDGEDCLVLPPSRWEGRGRIEA